MLLRKTQCDRNLGWTSILIAPGCYLGETNIVYLCDREVNKIEGTKDCKQKFPRLALWSIAKAGLLLLFF